MAKDQNTSTHVLSLGLDIFLLFLENFNLALQGLGSVVELHQLFLQSLSVLIGGRCALRLLKLNTVQLLQLLANVAQLCVEMEKDA